MLEDYFARDPRIPEDSPMRDLEIKIHYLMMTLSNAGLLEGGSMTIPDDCDTKDVFIDATSVSASTVSYTHLRAHET